jgi:hypothetical protein
VDAQSLLQAGEITLDLASHELSWRTRAASGARIRSDAALTERPGGLKAATDRSYHGGSFRGGYGHGLAADVVSVNGATRAQRSISTESLWKWIDAHL